MLTILDEYTRQCWVIHVERQIQSRQVFETLLQVMAIYGVPEHIRSDNGSEFIAHAIQQGLKDHHIKTLYIEPGSPGKMDLSRMATQSTRSPYCYRGLEAALQQGRAP